ncbi:MAG TPA: hypothetical protein VFM58_17615 [Solirubrobacteraceae bacterium]|nr:hypothetical protein [Solirubrobacteraceae bacterium]
MPWWLDLNQPRREVRRIEPRPQPIGTDRGDVPAGERRPQLVLADGVRATGPVGVTEAEHVQRAARHGREAGHVGSPFIGVERVEQAAVEHRFERASQPVQVKGVAGLEGRVDAAFARLLAGDRERGRRHVDPDDVEAERGDVQGVLPGPAAGVEHGAAECAFGGQPDDRRLRLPDVPRRPAVAVRRIPRLAGPLLVTERHDSHHAR